MATPHRPFVIRRHHFGLLVVVVICAVVFLTFSTRPNNSMSPATSLQHPKPWRPKPGLAEPPGTPKAKFKIDYSKAYDVCAVGAGLSGVIFAERFANVLGKTALVLDSRHHIGGNCYDHVDKSTGILMNKYGAHLFRTNDERAWRYINLHASAPKWLHYQHEVRGWIGKRLLPIPVNAYTVNALFNLSIQTEDEMKEWLSKVQIPCPKTGCQTAEQLIKSRVGVDLYKAIFYDYTVKQWNKEPGQLKPAAAARIPVYTSFDPRYFTAKYQVLPSKGYTAWFAAILDHPRIDVVLKTNFFDHRAYLEKVCGLIVYTGPIDSYFSDSGIAKLEYRSIEFVEKRHFNVGYVQATSVVNYPSKDVQFTRSVEYKHFLNQEHSPHSIVVSERSTDKGDPYYPVPSEQNLQLYAKYKKLAQKAEESGRVIFVGRLANYKYFSMDEAIVNAVQLFYKAAEKLGMTKELGDYSIWMKEPSEQQLKRSVQPEKETKVASMAAVAPKPQPQIVKSDSKVVCPTPKWRSLMETPRTTLSWLSGTQTISTCFGLRPGSLHSAARKMKPFATHQKKVDSANVAIILRGHFREVDRDQQAADNLHLLLKFFPKSKVFIQSWSVRQTSHSWRQHSVKKFRSGEQDVTDKHILDYYHIPQENFGGIIVESEEKVMPILKELYTAEELAGVVCSGIHNPSFAPNIGWLQMFWGIMQGSELVQKNGPVENFDVVLNFRHDGYATFHDVIPNWTTLRDLIVKYLENVSTAPTDISCWSYQKGNILRPGIDSAYVTGAASNYKLAAKWLYNYKALQEITCRVNKHIHQEELVPISALFLT